MPETIEDWKIVLETYGLKVGEIPEEALPWMKLALEIGRNRARKDFVTEVLPFFKHGNTIH